MTHSSPAPQSHCLVSVFICGARHVSITATGVPRQCVRAHPGAMSSDSDIAPCQAAEARGLSRIRRRPQFSRCGSTRNHREDSLVCYLCSEHFAGSGTREFKGCFFHKKCYLAVRCFRRVVLKLGCTTAVQSQANACWTSRRSGATTSSRWRKLREATGTSRGVLWLGRSRPASIAGRHPESWTGSSSRRSASSGFRRSGKTYRRTRLRSSSTSATTHHPQAPEAIWPPSFSPRVYAVR